jgi:predicted ester cyclase
MSGHDSVEANARVVRDVEAAWQANDMDAIDRYVADDFVAHTPGADQLPPGREGAKGAHQQSLGAMVDRRTTIEDLVADGDRVFIRSSFTGTHSKEFMGVPTTGRKITVDNYDIVRIADGRATDHWGIFEVLGMLGQMGVLPGPGEGMAEDAPGAQ